MSALFSARIPRGVADGRHTSISFSVSTMRCLSCSCDTLREQDFQSPSKPMSSKMASSLLVDSRALANLLLDVKVWSRACADSSVAEFWQCKRMSSRMEMIGPQLDVRSVNSAGQTALF